MAEISDENTLKSLNHIFKTEFHCILELMRKDFHVSQFFQVNSILYYMANLFVLVGLIEGTLLDLRRGLTVIIVGDIATIFFLVILFILAQIGKIHRNLGLAILLILATYNYQAGAVSGIGQDVSIAISTLTSTMGVLVFASVGGFVIDKRFTIIMGLINVVFFTIMTWVFNDEYLRSNYILNLIIIVGYSVVIYYYRFSLEHLAQNLYRTNETLKEQKKQLAKLKDKAEQLNEINRPFVIFGKNTAGLVHDFKNDASLISSFSQLVRLKMNRGIEFNLDELDKLDSYVDRLVKRIDLVKYASSARNHHEVEMIDVEKLIESAVYPFKLSPFLKNKIHFKVEVQSDVSLWSSRFLMLQILENLIRNSCEALLDQSLPAGEKNPDAYILSADLSPNDSMAEHINHMELGTIGISCQLRGETVTFKVEDDGPGIGFCFDCEEDNCTNCQTFEIGKTTKTYGSGYGMVNIFNAVNRLGGRIFIESSPTTGTSISFEIPRRIQQELLNENLFSVDEVGDSIH